MNPKDGLFGGRLSVEKAQQKQKGCQLPKEHQVVHILLVAYNVDKVDSQGEESKGQQGGDCLDRGMAEEANDLPTTPKGNQGKDDIIAVQQSVGEQKGVPIRTGREEKEIDRQLHPLNILPQVGGSHGGDAFIVGQSFSYQGNGQLYCEQIQGGNGYASP